MDSLDRIAPEFIRIAHSIVWATAATVSASGRPRSRILHPIWQWDESSLVGWVATSPLSPKARDIAHLPEMSFTYWRPNHDTCTVECAVD